MPPTAYRPSRPQASEAQLREAAQLLADAERPLVLSGSGVDRGDANAALLQLVDLLKCPVMTTMAGRSTVPSDHPSYIFGFGCGGDVVKQEADVVLVAGSRLGNLDLPYDKYWGDSARKKFIHIDVDPRNMGVTRPLALGMVADVQDALAGLVRVLGGMKRRPRDSRDLERYRRAAQEWWEAQIAPIAGWSGPGMHPAHVMEAIGATFGRDAVYVADGGNTSLWANSYLPPTRPRSYHSILELGMLGTGIPSAVGAKLGAPEREVVCVTGDGATGFNFMEMQSAARDGIKITTIVFAEGAWTMEEPNERMLYGRTFGTEQGTVRWDRVAEGLGCHGEYVERIEDVAPALRRAKDATGPAVVCARTDREANLGIPQEMMLRFFEVYQGPIE